MLQARSACASAARTARAPADISCAFLLANTACAARSSGVKCSSIAADVQIFCAGAGKVTNEEKQGMFDLLAVAAEEQASAGNLADCDGCSAESVSSSPSGGGSGSSGSSIIPIACGAAAALAALVAGAAFWKKHKVSTAGRSTEKGGEMSESDKDGDHVVEARVVGAGEGQRAAEADAHMAGEEGKGCKDKK